MTSQPDFNALATEQNRDPLNVELDYLREQNAALQLRFNTLLEQSLLITKERDEWKKLVHGNLQVAQFMKEQAEQVLKEIDAKARGELFKEPEKDKK